MEDFYDDVMKAICIISHIENEIDICNMNLVKYLTNNFNFTMTITNLNLKKYVRGNHQNYFMDEYNKKYDLLLDIGKGVKHYSSNYGKLNKFDFCDIFNIDESNIKKHIMNNTKNLLEIYHKHIFHTNTIVILFNKQIINDTFNYNIYVFDDFVFNYEIKTDKLTYTRKLEEWNVSNTLKYNDITIGNFIIGKNVEFAYNLNNYIYILNRLDRI